MTMTTIIFRMPDEWKRELEAVVKIASPPITMSHIIRQALVDKYPNLGDNKR